jgi:hypothetical protein
MLKDRLTCEDNPNRENFSSIRPSVLPLHAVVDGEVLMFLLLKTSSTVFRPTFIIILGDLLRIGILPSSSAGLPSQV